MRFLSVGWRECRLRGSLSVGKWCVIQQCCKYFEMHHLYAVEWRLIQSFQCFSTIPYVHFGNSREGIK